MKNITYIINVFSFSYSLSESSPVVTLWELTCGNELHKFTKITLGTVHKLLQNSI